MELIFLRLILLSDPYLLEFLGLLPPALLLCALCIVVPKCLFLLQTALMPQAGQ